MASSGCKRSTYNARPLPNSQQPVTKWTARGVNRRFGLLHHGWLVKHCKLDVTPLPHRRINLSQVSGTHAALSCCCRVISLIINLPSDFLMPQNDEQCQTNTSTRLHWALRPQKPLRLIRDGEVWGSRILYLTPTRYTVTTRMILH